ESTLDSNSSTLDNNSTTQAELIFDRDIAQTIDDLEVYVTDFPQALADVVQVTGNAWPEDQAKPPEIRIPRQTRSQVQETQGTEYPDIEKLPKDSVSAETTTSPRARNPSESYTGVPRLSSSYTEDRRLHQDASSSRLPQSSLITSPVNFVISPSTAPQQDTPTNVNNTHNLAHFTFASPPGIPVHPSPLVLPTVSSTGPPELSTSRDPRSSHVKSLPVKSQPSLGKYSALIRTPSETKATSLRRALKKLTERYSRARELQYSRSQDHLNEKLNIFVDLYQQASVEPRSFYFRYLQDKAFSYQKLEREDRFLTHWLTLQFSAFDTRKAHSTDSDTAITQLESYTAELQYIQKG
ncbi:hypothetical protein DL98DRAFT_516152, partial [Cadophora sp. DSE1049]